MLETAETLSRQVLSSMMAWNHGASGVGVSGLIVDGALSLGNLERSEASSSKPESAETVAAQSGSQRHEWISQATMRRICPGVILSNYQLIGVNWLALLNSMECNIDGKNTPVNGILADEMGLVSFMIR